LEDEAEVEAATVSLEDVRRELDHANSNFLHAKLLGLPPSPL